MRSKVDPKAYPHLFAEAVWASGPTQARFTLLASDPKPDLISNINIVPRCAGQWVQLQHANQQWDLPGGTLEPGEFYLDTLRRELVEEAGAVLLNFQLFGAWHCHSQALHPYRPHLPHPEYYRLVGWGEIEVTTNPQIPTGGEQIIQVAQVALATALANFRACGRDDLADLYQLAGDLFE